VKDSSEVSDVSGINQLKISQAETIPDPSLVGRSRSGEDLTEPHPAETNRVGEDMREDTNLGNTVEVGQNIDLTRESDLLPRFYRDVEAAGLVGEEGNAVAVFLCALSARLSNPLNLTVQGASSSGKNYLLGRVALFIPDEMKKFLTGMTPKALMHAAEDEFEHKAVFIAEFEGVARADYAIRTLQSEQLIEWQFADSTQDGIRTKTNRVRGPAAFIQATTRPLLHAENETRLLFVQMDESPKLTVAILRRQAEEAASPSSPIASTNLCAPWHELIRSLKITQVAIPFATALVDYLPPENVRTRRDFPKLLELIRTSAFLHQHQRGRTDDAVVADHRDYKSGKNLFEYLLGAGPEESIAELVRLAKWFHEENSYPYFRIPDVIRETGWGKSKAYQVLARAEELGCIAEAEKRGYYRFVRSSEIPPLELPKELSPILDPGETAR
jgi:hypothetical protein